LEIGRGRGRMLNNEATTVDGVCWEDERGRRDDIKGKIK